MTRLPKLFATIMASTCLCAPVFAQDDISTIALIADSSLAAPLADIVRDYTRSAQVAISASFETVQTQEKEVAEGAAYDILITARPKLIESLKQLGLVDIYSEAAIARNALVLVSSDRSTFSVSLADHFPLVPIINTLGLRPGFVLGNPETLYEGSMARDALRRYDVLEDMEAYTLYEKELPEIVSLVKDQNSFAMMYASDAQQVAGLRIIDTVPQDMHPPIIYYAVVLAGDQMEGGRAFVEYLKQASAQKTFTRYGFLKP